MEYNDPDWEAKEIRRRIDERDAARKEDAQDVAERAFVMGYFNRPDPPASFVTDIADGNLAAAWNRCKPHLLRNT